MQGKLRLCSCVFVVLCLLCGVIRCLYGLNKMSFFKSLSLLYKLIVSDLNKFVTLSVELQCVAYPTLFVLQIRMISQIVCLVDETCAVTFLSD